MGLGHNLYFLTSENTIYRTMKQLAHNQPKPHLEQFSKCPFYQSKILSLIALDPFQGLK